MKSHIGEHHVGTGSGENEIYGMANSIDEGLSFSYMMEEMGQDFPLPMVMKVDATTAEDIRGLCNGHCSTIQAQERRSAAEMGSSLS